MPALNASASSSWTANMRFGAATSDLISARLYPRAPPRLSMRSRSGRNPYSASSSSNASGSFSSAMLCTRLRRTDLSIDVIVVAMASGCASVSASSRTTLAPRRPESGPASAFGWTPWVTN